MVVGFGSPHQVAGCFLGAACPAWMVAVDADVVGTVVAVATFGSVDDAGEAAAGGQLAARVKDDGLELLVGRRVAEWAI